MHVKYTTPLITYGKSNGCCEKSPSHYVEQYVGFVESKYN